MKEKSHLDIVVDAQHLVLKGAGPDAEPVRLSGQVLLYLTEDTAIRELTLQFRGKAKIPVPASESLINNNSSVTYVVCSHDWSFLEGDKRHSRTLKAGRHCFNFQLDVGASLPSSIFSTACGGASVTYKLRATATRPGLSHNISHITPVYILRTFTPESLEYQQTLEIENTWPEKLMYAIMLPHKAWAGGDTLSAVLKFSPLAKGVTVDKIVTKLCETTKVFARSGHQEETKVIASAAYDLVDGQVVGQDPRPGSSRNDADNQDIVTCINLAIPRSTLHRATSLNTSSQLPTPPLSHNNSSTHLPSIASVSALTPQTPHTTHTPFTSHPIPVTPSHSLDPISVTHRIRWSIFIRNRDGHVSELRCSLPVAILDTRFLSDARAHSGPSRRMLLETSGLGHLTHTLGLDGPQSAAQDADRELPSYTAHVRDRVAYPENAGGSAAEVMCLSGCSSPVVTGTIFSAGASSSTSASLTHNLATAPQSGYGTPSRQHDAHAMPMSQLPPHPGNGANVPLEWLLSSLGDESPGPSSRLPSRAPSPDREMTSSSSVASASGSPSSSSAAESSSSSSSRHHHHRGLGSLFKAFTSLTHHHHNHDKERSGASPGHSRPPSRGPSSRRTSFDLHQQPTVDSSNPTTPVDQAFSAVPDYSTASRGFLLGGVPPLSSMRGLPSYEEVERERRVGGGLMTTAGGSDASL